MGEVPATQPTRIALIEDDDGVRDAVRLMLELHGFHVRPFSSGSEFLEVCDQADCCGLIVDYHLMDMNGMALLRRLAERGIRIPAIVITATVVPELESLPADSPVIAVLEKPFSSDRLLLLVTRLHSGA